MGERPGAAIVKESRTMSNAPECGFLRDRLGADTTGPRRHDQDRRDWPQRGTKVTKRRESETQDGPGFDPIPFCAFCASSRLPFFRLDRVHSAFIVRL